MRLRLLLALVLFPAILRAEDKPQDKLLTAHVFKQRVRKVLREDYLLFLPKDYKAKSDKQWPLLLFLHGAGERGTNVWRVDIHGPSHYILDHPDFPFIMVSPLCPADETWSNEILLGLLDDILADYKVDKQRVYLSGLSMGGFGTWSLALEHPEKFAAAIPICGGGDDLPVILARTGYTSPAKKEALKSLPIWAFHGGKDNVVPPEESERMVESLKKLGVAEVKLTIYPEAQHNSWAETYSNPQIYEWLLSHRRD